MPLLAVALALALWRVGLWSRGVPLIGHVFFLAHPLITQVCRQLQAGTPPVWNPYAYCGVPLLADPQAGVLNPGHVAFRFFSFETAFKLNLAVDVALACLFTYALARRFGARRSAALIAALIGSCNGFLYYHSPMVAQADALVWVPAVLLFWSAGGAWLTGLALALCYLGGNPFFVYIALAGCLALRPRRGTLSLLAAASLIALTLASPQLLAAIELFRRSTRSGPLAPAALFVYSVPPGALLRQLAVPLWNRSAEAFVGDPTITSFYVGLPALALAAAGFAAAKTGRRAAAAWTGAGLLLMLGAASPVYPALLKVAPGLSLFRFPAQWGVLAAAGLSLAAALGAERLYRPARLALGAAVAVDLWLFLGQAPTTRASAEFFSLKPAALAAAAAAVRVAHTTRLLEAQAGAVVQGDPQRYWLRQNEGLVPSRGTVFGLREALSYNLYEPGATSRALRGALSGERPDLPLLRAAAVGAVVDGSPSSGYRVVPVAGASPRVSWSEGSGQAVMVDESPTRLAVRTRARVDGAVIWADTSFAGWRAFVDGREESVRRVAPGFRAVLVASGEHDVRWVYRSRPLLVGLVLAVCCIFTGAAIAMKHGFCYP